MLIPQIGPCSKVNVQEKEARISDLSILNLLVLVLWHYTDSKSHNNNTEDKEKKKWNYPV